MKWTIQKAATEFGVDPKTIRSGLARNEVAVKKGRGSSYTTRQITAAIFGDLKGERIRETRARADLLELKRKEREGVLVPMDVARKVLADVLLPVRTELLAASSTLAGRANPGDPELARRAIHECNTGILQRASDAASKV
jgi:phage terminase Nu1 subunit (DNA packaging protein)